MFIGSYDYTIDQKSRLVIPSKFRNEIGNETNVYLTRGFDGCISIYKESDFENLISRYHQHSFEKKEVRQTLRSFLDSVLQITLDSQGRILIPQKVLEKFKISSKVHILGAIDHFEIWDSIAWEEEENKNSETFEENAEKIFQYED